MELRYWLVNAPSSSIHNPQFHDSLLRRAIPRNVSFRISLRWPIHFINSVDKTKLSRVRWSHTNCISPVADQIFYVPSSKPLPCIRLARGKFELTNQDSAGGKNSSVLTSRWNGCNQAAFVTGDGIKYPRKGIYNFKTQTSWQKVKNMNHFCF